MDAPTLAQTRTFLLYRIPSLLPLLLLVAARAFLQSHQLTRPLLVSAVVANIVNLVAGIALVHGGAGLPEWTGPMRAIPAMGVAGAAITSSLATFVQLAILFRAMRLADPSIGRVWLRWTGLRSFATVLRLGAPIGLQTLAEIGCFAAIGFLAIQFGPEELAAHNIALSLVILSVSLVQGIAAAGTVRVGRSIGARDSVATRRSGRMAFSGGGLSMLVSCLCFWLLPDELSRLLSDDAEIVAIAGKLLLVASVFQIFDGLQIVAVGVLRGAGDTRFPLYINLLGYYLVGLPAGMVCAFGLGLGIVGLWIGLLLAVVGVASSLVMRCNRLAGKPIAPIAVAA